MWGQSNLENLNRLKVDQEDISDDEESLMMAGGVMLTVRKEMTNFNYTLFMLM